MPRHYTTSIHARHTRYETIVQFRVHIPHICTHTTRPVCIAFTHTCVHHIRLRNNCEVLAEQGLLYWWLLGKQRFLFQLCWLKYMYMLKSILMVEINHTRYVRHFVRLSGPNVAKQSAFWRADFQEKNQISEM